MARREKIQPNGRPRSFPDAGTIVSKTDLQGRILYANTTFLDVAAYSEDELIGQLQNIIRHPDMAAGLFKILWDELQARGEVFSYINNLAQDGVNYWVFAHVTQSHDAAGRHIGYHSTRRTVPLSTLAVIEPIYHRIDGFVRETHGALLATRAGGRRQRRFQ